MQLLEIPLDSSGNVFNILHFGNIGNLRLVVVTVSNTPQIPGKVLSGLQTGDVLPFVLIGQAELFQGCLYPLPQRRTFRHRISGKGGLYLGKYPWVTK